ncbi:hypothetical protein XELAEV_18009977mg [Xenopus laevis]|uniref:Uncharacterized protein n=1 Tax=Xenopus laevis TaxID=8355 RepID=A0A974DTB1_XENLA|nr:hypothetical protein XELAEV_18009977mg [Xenopus laevis]
MFLAFCVSKKMPEFVSSYYCQFRHIKTGQRRNDNIHLRICEEVNKCTGLHVKTYNPKGLEWQIVRHASVTTNNFLTLADTPLFYTK